MVIETLQQAKNTLQTMTESLWIFSALNVMVETGALAILIKETPLSTLEEISKLPASVLEQTINVLLEAGFIISTNANFKLSPGIQALVETVGLEKMIAQLRVTLGLTNEFTKSSREKNLKPGWHYTDEYILQAQGTYSEYIVTDCIPQSIQLQNLLNTPHTLFLDVGAGVGKITLRLCQLYQHLRVVALEPADVPFSLAKKNIDESIFSNRIELRKECVEEVEDKNSFDAVWFPHVFFSDKIFVEGLRSVWRAMKPGGMLLTTALSTDKHNQSTRIRYLLNSLYGGLRTVENVVKVLHEVGFEKCDIFSEISGYQTITVAKPL